MRKILDMFGGDGDVKRGEVEGDLVSLPVGDGDERVYVSGRFWLILDYEYQLMRNRETVT